MICERCYQPEAIGEHGLYKCPLEARRNAAVIWTDSIPGGMWIQNAICNEDGTPRRYDSWTEYRDACRAKGVTPWTDVYEEDRTKDARVHDDWLKSGEARKARKEREDMRAEKKFQRERQAVMR